MRNVKYIVIHCSASKPSQKWTVEDIDKMHKKRGFRMVGYHFIITQNGTVQEGRPIEAIGAHVKGYNYNSIGICYVGGLDSKGKPKDTRTKEQTKALDNLLIDLLAKFPKAQVCGHRDFSPDSNGDGKITPNEFIKMCPCFDAHNYATVTEKTKDSIQIKWKYK